MAKPLLSKIDLMVTRQRASMEVCKFKLNCGSGESEKGSIGFFRGVKETESISMVSPHLLEIFLKTSMASFRLIVAPYFLIEFQ